MIKNKINWDEVVQNQMESGKSIKQFCLDEGISLGTFRYHKYNNHKILDEPLRLIPIVKEPVKPLSFSLNGKRVEVDASIDDDALRKLVRAIV